MSFLFTFNHPGETIQTQILFTFNVVLKQLIMFGLGVELCNL